MRLSSLLQRVDLQDTKPLVGDPAHVEVWRVNELTDDDPEMTVGTLFLASDRERLGSVVRLGREFRETAFLIEDAMIEGTDVSHVVDLKGTLLVHSGRIPLGLSARIQRVLDAEAGPSLSADTIARARQDLIEDLVLGRYQDATALLRRAHALGVNFEHATTVMVVGFANFERFYVQHEARGELYFQQLKGNILQIVRREALQEDGSAVVIPHAEGALVLLGGGANRLGERLATVLTKELRFVPISVASGTQKEGIDLLSKSYQEARLAMQLRQRLRMQDRFVAFERLTGYALLQQIQTAPEIAYLLESELEPLLEAEYGRRPLLIETMAAYFDAGTSLKRAAEHLQIHPKTLRYRLNRIEEILGEGALEGEKRLLLYLAAKLFLWTEA